MLKTIKPAAAVTYATHPAGPPPVQILAVKAKNEMPQIKFTKEYKPVLDKIYSEMDAEFKALRA